MIDLRFKELPSQLESGGNFYFIDTDFRTWIQFGKMLTEEHIAWDGIFTDKIPEGEWLEAAIEFYKSENVCPHDTPYNPEKIIDYVRDGDYIVAAFKQAYNIDLTTADMHWHYFKALLSGLPEDTLLAKIMAYRSYRKSNEDHDTTMRRLKQQWSLPDPKENEKREQLLAWAEEFLG